MSNVSFSVRCRERGCDAAGCAQLAVERGRLAAVELPPAWTLVHVMLTDGVSIEPRCGAHSNYVLSVGADGG